MVDLAFEVERIEVALQFGEEGLLGLVDVRGVDQSLTGGLIPFPLDSRYKLLHEAFA